MKKVLFNLLFTLMTFFIAGTLFSFQARQKLDPEVLECLDLEGHVISYGASCAVGGYDCTPNDCPKPDPVQ